MDPRPVGLNRREVPMADGRVIVLRVYPMPPEIRDGIAAALADGERDQRRLDLARVVWLIAVLAMGLTAVAAVCLSQ